MYKQPSIPPATATYHHSMSNHGIHGNLLEVTVVGCSKLKDTEWISRQDPYVCVEYGSNRNRTPVCTDGGKNPKFKEKFVYSLIEGLRELNIVVWNRNTISHDDFIGSNKVQLAKVLSQGFDDSSWPLQTKTGRHAGEVRLIMHYSIANNAPNSLAPSAPPYVTATAPQVSMYYAPPPPSYMTYPPPPSSMTYPPPPSSTTYPPPPPFTTYPPPPSSTTYPPPPSSNPPATVGAYPISTCSSYPFYSGGCAPTPYPPPIAPYPPLPYGSQYPQGSTYLGGYPSAY